jgi:hypothetical protein
MDYFASLAQVRGIDWAGSKRVADLPCYLGEVPKYEIRNGKMHVSLDGFALVMPIHVFLAGCEQGKRAIKSWQATRKDAVVIPISALR